MVSDRRQSGRPNERGDSIDDVQAAIEDNPKTSTRRLSDELNMPRTTVRRILKKDLLLKAWKPTFVQYLTEEDHQNRVECCTAILQKYPSSLMRKRLLFSDECAIYADECAVRQAFEDIDSDKGLLQRIHNRTFRRLSLCINIQGLQVDPFDI